MSKSIHVIAVDLTPVLPGGENGGAKIFVFELLRRLSEMNPQTQFILLTQINSHEELASLESTNVRRLMVVGPVVVNSLRPRLMKLAFRILPHLPGKLRNIIRRIGFRLNSRLKRGVHGSLLKDLGVDLLFCPFTATTYFENCIPTVATVYDLQYKTYPEFFSIEDVIHRDRTFVDACRNATVLVAISDYSRASAIHHGNLDSSCIRTIHLRMALRMIDRSESNCEILFGLGLIPKKYVIYPANFWKHKNHEMLLTAFSMACHKGLPADIKLVCTGAPGARLDWLVNSTRAMNLSDRVCFPGYISNNDLAILISNCAGVIFPSLYEGFGLPVIEAMAARVPVACSDTTSLPEIAANAAILFNPRIPDQIAQSIVTLVTDEPTRQRLIQAGLNRAMEFSDSERMADEYWQTFQYALTNLRDENLLTGVHPDGWSGAMLSLQVASSKMARVIEIVFFAPEWLPQSRLKVQAYHDGRPEGTPLMFKRGTSGVLSINIKPTGGIYEIRVTPTFIPAFSGYGNDQRELSALLHRCTLLEGDGDRLELYQERSFV